MKNIFNILITIIIIIFSFYYTNLITNYIKNKDPIMIELINNKNNYYKKPINAIIENNTIIPGLNGLEIDINKSYKNLKKINKFQESLLIYKEIKPSISLYNNYNKLIINGNLNNKKISILLKINDLEIYNKIINNNYFNKINLILTNHFINNYNDIINNNIIVIKDTELINNLNLINYCYTTNLNQENNCLKYNKLTIIPTFINKDYYINTFNIIKNGSILAYEVLNIKDLIEIKLIINEINNYYEIVNLNNLLKEEN